MRQMINMEIDPPARRVEPKNLSSHLICIGQNVSLSGADRTLVIQSILLSPTGADHIPPERACHPAGS